jgi:flavin reductase (DIM6/NTAB) family NADH-FMN oxidoreductase RutF
MLPTAPQDRGLDRSTHCVPSTEFRNALSKLATAVSVVTTAGPAGAAGVTCSAICALSDDPAMVLVCVHGKARPMPPSRKTGSYV